MEFWKKFSENGYIEKRRNEQKIEWFNSLLEQEILRRFYSRPGVRAMMEHFTQQIANSATTIAAAVKKTIEVFDGAGEADGKK